MYSALDLFAGCGGLSLGFSQAGFSVDAAVEFDASAAETFQRNFPSAEVFVQDIQIVNEFHLVKKFTPDVIIGGPPCQGFSMAGSRNRHGFTDDPRNYLFKHYLGVVQELKPKVFIMENVKGMLSMQGGAVFQEIIAAFTDPSNFDGEEYSVDWQLVNAQNFGIPQARERLILIGVKGHEFQMGNFWERATNEVLKQFPNFFEPVNVADAIRGLPFGDESGEIANPKPLSQLQKYLASNQNTVLNHRPSRHSTDAIRRMKLVKPGENYTVIPEEIKSVHSGSYGRLKWEDKAATITTRFDTPAGGRFTHPEFHRTLTPREAARLQTFPDSFEFVGENRSISRQIGNAVPPKLSRFFAELVKLVLQAKTENLD